PENANAANNLGTLLAQRGDLEAAMDMFQRAVEADPGHDNAARNLARAKKLLGR
ncbi:MAG: tetratricopeptide repeat protein, partial [Calditrichaeota bacterium]|nr:tetratricopeptide repeat protein [Calditrichota bacterium]